jgi:hypothetical protein
MLVVLVLVIRDAQTSKITACGVAPYAFRRGEPSRAQPNFVSKYIRTHSRVEQL